MTVNDVVAIANNALWTIIKLAAPPLLVSLVVGLVVSIFQTITSIQEQTLTFVPKILAVFMTLMLLGHWILGSLAEYMTQLWSDFSVFVR
ncbi:MAG: flagellar biosynthesis protein FliQ [Lachnospiraceae bacterium]|nr:flagellar biosynthesis protein FliQ [Lachnospiraceae bacterium]